MPTLAPETSRNDSRFLKLFRKHCLELYKINRALNGSENFLIYVHLCLIQICISDDCILSFQLYLGFNNF